ncbi:MAG: 30S ribosomal protein S7 [Myxococcota bacterium]|nr:30S ribosomal protein S7 [Myxococcota bacterium]
MSRRRSSVKRDIGKDPKYGDWLVQKFINCLMKDGKKATAEGLLYSVFDDIERRTNEDPLKFFKRALDNVRPAVEVKSRRVGGSTYQVPVEVRPDRRTALAIRWLILYARKRGERGMVQKLSGEIIDAANNRGSSVKKKEDTHRMAEANKAFSHFRW